MATTPEPPLDDLRLLDAEHWTDGPPLETFKRLRAECPVHWSPGMTDFPEVLVDHDGRAHGHGE